MEGHRTACRAARLAALSVFLCAFLGVDAGSAQVPGPGLGQVADQASRSIVAVLAQRTEVRARPGPGPSQPRLRTRIGSGVAVDESYVLTTASVALGAERITVRASNGLQAEAHVLGLDLVYNVALLHVPDLRLPWIHPAQRAPQIGDRMIALGTSFGERQTQSVGTIEYVFREPRGVLMQLTNVVQPGNSGGAALNTRGELCGLILGELGAPEINGGGGGGRLPGGMSFMMPVDFVWPVYDRLRRDGRVPHGYLGVSTRAEVVVSDVDQEEIGLGARIEAVVSGGPAARAGLRRGDLVVGFESDRVEYPEQLARWVARTLPGTPVNLVWVRGELRRTGRAVLGESRDSLPLWALTPSTGPSPRPRP
jgi:S1-C subfamily serine protease